MFVIPVIMLISISHVNYADAQNQTQTLLQFQPGTIVNNPPLLKSTAQVVELQGTIIGVRDPNDPTKIIPKEVQFQPPTVTGPSVTGTLDSNGLFATAAPEVGFGERGVKGAQLSSESPGTGGGLFATSSPVLLTSKAAGLPTFNPPLMNCETKATIDEKTGKISGGSDVAKYVFTGNVNRHEFKGDNFVFQIFADLVDGDDLKFNGKDAPYQVSFLTNDVKDQIDVDMEEIGTGCIDIQKVINLEKKAEIDPDRSLFFKTMDKVVDN